MTDSTFPSRRAFVAELRDSDPVALLDFTRDGYRTVIVATRTHHAAESARALAADAGYQIATTWETSQFEYVVFTTSVDPVPGIVDASAPPPSLVDEALAYFSDLTSP